MHKITITSLLIASWLTILIAVWLITGGIANAGGHGTPILATPSIVKTTIHKDGKALIITGHNFGTAPPMVALADQLLEIKRYSQQEIVAALPREFAAATYSLTVTTGGQNRAISEPFSTTLPDLANK